MPWGKILRDTNAGPGIVFVNGEQTSFTLEAHWKSSSPPKVGAVVDVVLGEAGVMVAVSHVEESELATKQT